MCKTFFTYFLVTGICLLHRYLPGVLMQGRLKIWTEHSTLILLISKPFEAALPKVQHIYNLRKNEFSPNLKGVAQKMCPLCPLEVFDVFGGKSKSKAPRAFIFSKKGIPTEVNIW